MPNFFAGTLAWFFGVFLSKIVYRAMFALGIGFISFQAVDGVMASIESLIVTKFGELAALEAFTIAIIDMTNVDSFISAVISAYVVVFALKSSKVALRAVGG